ncbi:DUF3795 domain-containing protein [candidate division WOR-3 bacterium]|uniref:DUF3795 domain-containing protein n=1 Tax=candidate division WOR-3 bacterium TaxID=2052148 RepID=A0A9D5K9Z9_UNCW3|nr:DUF3795 domain-containing protein [candidate division WOR-3 bacterium]MBD3364315.1 DUF3795 domain-containing protein [candidate division WOR-3 bacterium]
MDRVDDFKTKGAEMNSENKMIAACGLQCHNCDIYQAPDNPEIAQRIVAWLKRERNIEIGTEAIRCFGCKQDRSECWSEECWIRECCVDKKKLEFCSECEDFPCNRLVEWSQQNNGYAKGLARLRRMKQVD